MRDVAVARRVLWWWSNDRTQLGVTVDVQNQSADALTIDVAACVLEVQPPGPSTPEVIPAIAEGLGHLPAAVTASSAAILPPIPLAWGETKRFWILFEPGRWSANSRIALRVPTMGGEPIRLTLFDAAPAHPRWLYENVTSVGISSRFETDLFGSDGYGELIGAGVWIARGSLRLDLGYWFGLDYARGTGDTLARAFTVGFGPTLAWHPRPTMVGVFAAGAVSFADFGTGSGVSDRNWSPSMSVGVESTSATGPAPPVFFRLGYLHIFDESVSRKDGVMLTVGTNARFW